MFGSLAALPRAGAQNSLILVLVLVGVQGVGQLLLAKRPQRAK